MGKNWYRLVDLDIGPKVKHYEFGIVVDQEYVEAARDDFDPNLFQRHVNDFVGDFGYEAEFDLYADRMPFLWGIDLGRSSAALFFNRDADAFDIDEEREVAYSTHNCDNFIHRGILLSCFYVWAQNIELSHSCSEFFE